MNTKQTLEMLEDILPQVNIRDFKGNVISSTLEDKRAALNALTEISDLARVEQLNTRTLGKLIGEARNQRLTEEKYDVRKLIVFALQEFGLV